MTFGPLPPPAPPLAALFDRRRVLQGGVLALAGLMARGAPRPRGGNLLGFRGIGPSTADAVRVPPGYRATPFALWGDPVGHVDGAPGFAPDASNTADEQALQFGMHHDGMHWFPVPGAEGDGSEHGLLCINHEYFDRGLIHPPRPAFGFTREEIQKEMNAVGISVCEVRRTAGNWRVVRGSRWARRITADSRIEIGGPARGDDPARPRRHGRPRHAEQLRGRADAVGHVPVV
jgi:secreted PhoX family phosphatase